MTTEIVKVFPASMNSTFMKKLISMLLVFCITLGGLTGIAFNTYAAESTVSGTYTVNGINYDLIRGTYKYASAVSVDGKNKDLSATFYYSDGFFMENPYAYNPHLATTSMNMAMAAYYSNEGETGPGADYTQKGQNIIRFMEDIGCEQIYTNKANTIRPQKDSIGVTIGRKQLKTSDETATGRTLIAIAIRGGNYELEWVSNATIGTGDKYFGEAEGFASAAEQVTAEIDAYIERNGLTDAVRNGKVVFWISGYSRAGAATNLTARRLVDKYAPTRFSGNKVFAYCNEAPQGGSKSAMKELNDYDCIHNVINKADLVPRVAPSEMGFFRYGVDHYIPGTPAGTVTGKSDNTAYTIGLQAYERRKIYMQLQLTDINPNIVFDDNFQVYGLDVTALRITLAGVASGAIPILRVGNLLGTAVFYLIKGGYKGYIVTGEPVTMDVFLDEFFTNLQDWTGTTRSAFAGGTEGNLQTAAQDFLAIVFDSTKEQFDAFANEIKSLWGNQVKLDDLIGIFFHAFGEWHKPDFKYKTYYTNKFVQWLKENGGFDKLGLTAMEKDRIFNKDLPVIVNVAMTWLSADYRQDLHNAKSMSQMFTFFANVKNIAMNHYAEVNLAWIRTEDSFYDNVGLDNSSVYTKQEKKKEKSFSLLDLLIPSARAESVSGANYSADEPELLYIGDHGAVEITMEHGYSLAAAMPGTVAAYYSDGTEKPVPIDWNMESAEWTYAKEFGQEWYGIEDYDESNPRPKWASVTGYYGDEPVFAEIYVSGLTEADPPIASMFELVYDQPISVELSTLGEGGKQIRYTLDGTDPRTSSTAQDYKEPLELGSGDKEEDIYILAYTVSDDPSQYNDSDVLVFHYGFSGKGADPTATPKPVPQTGDSNLPGLWLGLMLLGLMGIAVTGAWTLKRKK